jgi:hypothetical protein
VAGGSLKESNDEPGCPSSDGSQQQIREWHSIRVIREDYGSRARAAFASLGSAPARNSMDEDLQRYDDALAAYDQALAIQPEL